MSEPSEVSSVSKTKPVSTPSEIEHIRPSVVLPPRPSAAWLIGCLFFTALVAAIALSAIGQALSFDGEPKMIPLVIWNALIALGQIAICAGAWRRDAWARSWVLGTSALQLASLTFAALTLSLQPVAFTLLIGCASLALVSYIAFRFTQSDFPHVKAISNPEDGGLLEHPRKLDPSMVITIALVLGSCVVQMISRLE